MNITKAMTIFQKMMSRYGINNPDEDIYETINMFLDTIATTNEKWLSLVQNLNSMPMNERQHYSKGDLTFIMCLSYAERKEFAAEIKRQRTEMIIKSLLKGVEVPTLSLKFKIPAKTLLSQVNKHLSNIKLKEIEEAKKLTFTESLRIDSWVLLSANNEPATAYIAAKATVMNLYVILNTKVQNCDIDNVELNVLINNATSVMNKVGKRILTLLD